MPRAARTKIRCAYADSDEEPLKAPKARKPRTVYTEEEKAARKLHNIIVSQERERKKEEKQTRLDWEAKLPTQTKPVDIPNDTKVMFISDAKKQFALSERELSSLPIYKFKSSPKRIIALSDLLEHAIARYAEIDVSCPALQAGGCLDGYEYLIPNVMTKTSQYVTGLLGRRGRYGW